MVRSGRVCRSSVDGRGHVALDTVGELVGGNVGQGVEEYGLLGGGSAETCELPPVGSIWSSPYGSGGSLSSRAAA